MMKKYDDDLFKRPHTLLSYTVKQQSTVTCGEFHVTSWLCVACGENTHVSVSQ